MSRPHVNIEGVKKVYGAGRDALEAIREASFAVGQGEFVSLLGPSGCGKSTLLMMVGGLLEPTAGQILVDGGRVTGPRKEVGIVFQSPVLLPWRTVLDNVLFPIEMLRLRRPDYGGRALELLEMTKLEEFRDKLPRELSGGMKQRVSICRALIHNPSLLLMDEPFSALDALTRDQLNLDLQKIWQQNHKTVLFVTHSITEAVFLSDRVVVMSPRPGTIERILEIDLPRPRSLDVRETPEFARYSKAIRDIFLARGVLSNS
ncbi:MAG: ABC transporter ATP-binding protein [Deltaproteobacteria bacterium]|nr:ABC transporter ATP-binding protein [Deltaproteobacteria bacterium]